MSSALSRIRSWYSRLSAVSSRLLLFGLGLTGVAALLLLTPSPYYISAPGAAIDTARVVHASGGKSHGGQLYMLILNTQPANLFWYLYARLDPRAALETKTEFLGEVPDYEKYVELNRQLMAESQRAAKAVALQQLGFGRGAVRVGARIVDLAGDSPSRGVLRKDDVVLEAGGKPVRSAADLTAIMLVQAPNAPVPLRVRRAGEHQQILAPAGEHPQRKGIGYLGILTRDEVEFDIPIDVKIDSGSIFGPSAGLMFTLQIIEQLSPESITAGLTVAGTGTVEPDGQVGAIGGVQQKVYTAEAAGAQMLFVPVANYADARKVATRVELVPVATVREALEYLKRKKTRQGMSPCLLVRRGQRLG